MMKFYFIFFLTFLKILNCSGISISKKNILFIDSFNNIYKNIIDNNRKENGFFNNEKTEYIKIRKGINRIKSIALDTLKKNINIIEKSSNNDIKLDKKKQTFGYNEINKKDKILEFEKILENEKLTINSETNIYIEDNKLDEIIKNVHITNEEIYTLYEDMYLGNMFENLVAKLYYNKRIHGFVHLYNGQEAISSGIIKNLNKNDFVVSTYRDHVHALSKNISPKLILNELYGNYYNSINKGKGGSMHIFNKENNFIGGFAFIGEQIPIAIGLSYSILYKENFFTNSEQLKQFYEQLKKNSEQLNVVVCFLGDGTTNMGQFYESLNLASIYNLPIMFVVENNNWAIGMENNRSTSNDLYNVYAKGKSFGIDTYKVDGNDVLSIYKLTKKLINDMRNKKNNVVLIEAITYRAKGHSLADPDELRNVDEKMSWRKRNPISLLQNYMIENNIANEDYFNNVKKKTQKLLNEIEKDAEENKNKNVNNLEVFKKNVFDDNEKIPYQNNYVNYKKYDNLSDEELENYYKAVLKEAKDKLENKKPDINEKVNQKHIPMIID